MSSNANSITSKRGRDDGPDEEEERRPYIRIKTEVELGEADYVDPPTPPLPRSTPAPADDGEIPCSTQQAAELDSLLQNQSSTNALQVIIKAEPQPMEEDEVDSANVNEPPPPQQPQPADEPRPSTSRGVRRPVVEENWEEEETRNDANVKENGSVAGDPAVIDFFNLGGEENLTAPSALGSEMKHPPQDTRPQERAAYYNITAEQEQQYQNQKIRTIPMYRKSKSIASGSRGGGGGSSGDEASDVSDNENNENELTTEGMQTRYFLKKSVYTKYDFDSRIVDSSALAVNQKKSHILDALDKKRVLIIEGFTGCGKTTQVPQFILDSCRERDKVCNIVVTQPRKIAAISVSQRVCEERGWNLGSIVGYQVGMESKKDPNETLLTFVTTGVLLQQLISAKSMRNYTHIIIDEVHERDLESDFLLLVIKKLMLEDTQAREQHVKVILMSATINTNKFADHFVFENGPEERISPHVVKIPFEKSFNIEELYLDNLLGTQADLMDLIESNLDPDKATIQEEIYEIAAKCITNLDDLEKAMEQDPRLRQKHGWVKNRGSVLVFLPGMEEIKKMERVLDSVEKDKIKEDQESYCWNIVPLHSSVSSDDQRKVFYKPKGGQRKIILSTNIAESSVTVPDISYVLDFCLTKSLCIDKTTNFTTLRLVWASKSQCVQRRGRTGRVAPGKVYRLVSKRFYQQLEEEILPEMKRSNLETIILMCKKFGFDNPVTLLDLALDKPDLAGIHRATATLKELGALTIQMEVDSKDSSGKKLVYDEWDGDMTFMGMIMADLPIPQQCTRLILFGHCFGVMQEAIVIAAGVSVKSPFQSGFRKQMDVYLKKLDHADQSFSDLFALYHVYKHWDEKFGSRKHTNQERVWAVGAEVHLPVLREIKATVTLIEERLKRLGIAENYTIPRPKKESGDSTAYHDELKLGSEQGLFLKLAIAGAFYPRYFLRRRPDKRQYEKETQKELGGQNPFKTVYFKSFPRDNDGRLYAKHVSNFLAHGLNAPAVKFEGQKVYAVFDNSTGETIGPFNKGMYKAIKMRQLRNMLEFNVLWRDREQAAISAWEARVARRRGILCPPLRELPPVNIHSVVVLAQHIINPTQFWVVLGNDFKRNAALFDIIQDNLVDRLLYPQDKLYPNALCLAPYRDENLVAGDHRPVTFSYYRAKIIRVIHYDNTASQVLCYFVDYGNTQWISASVLYDFSPAMIHQGIHKWPCMAIECRLQELKPNTVLGLHWSPESVKLMKDFTEKAHSLEMEIYSVYDNTIVGELVGFGRDRMERSSLNDLLAFKTSEKAKFYGDFTEEPYPSKENHCQRMRAKANNLHPDGIRAASFEQACDPFDLDLMDPPENARTPCMLKGPWSPLEMSFQALVNCSNTKEVRVENSSVNSVVLDHEPTSTNSRMLVAAHVGVVERSQAVMVRDSTIMSAIPGILSLVCLMFAPKAELRVDQSQSKYTGVLCGCGTVPEKNVSVHPDNDMEVVFDTEIDDDDITQINLIRNYMSNILKSGQTINKAETHKKLCNMIKKLLKRVRRSIDQEIWPQEEYVWNRISPEFLHPLGPVPNGGNNEIYQPHRKVRLNLVEDLDEVWDGGY